MVPFTGKREDALVRHGRWERRREGEIARMGGRDWWLGQKLWTHLVAGWIFPKKARPIFHACGFRPPMGCSANKNSLRSPHY